MTLALEYYLDIEQHKASYDGLSLVGYTDSNYASDTKSR